ncbi:hypothetical protein NQ318_017813 [Aromia moschata]|uniref:Cytochrome P450 n=1 Tax=Aromia moschata TaxID=1265417 RepID=A0AAV8YF81_9CUCU|nr:hypothetical protein NQ318_017813 [Aromia moschata]
MGTPYLVLRSPDIIKSITVRDFNNFEDRTFACEKDIDPMAGNSLFILRNPDWRNIRNKLTPIFTSGKLKLMFPIMKQCSRGMQNYLDEHDGDVMDIKEVSAKYMTDLVASCFFGLETNSFGKEESDFRMVCRKMFDFDIATAFRLFSFFFVPKFVSWFKLRLFDTDFLQSVFLDTIKQRQATNAKRNDFVDLLLQLRDNFNSSERGTNFDTQAMVSQAITFFIAGFETTSNAVAFALYELCLRQDCQDKLREEINKYVNTEDDITFDCVQK